MATDIDTLKWKACAKALHRALNDIMVFVPEQDRDLTAWREAIRALASSVYLWPEAPITLSFVPAIERARASIVGYAVADIPKGSELIIDTTTGEIWPAVSP